MKSTSGSRAKTGQPQARGVAAVSSPLDLDDQGYWGPAIGYPAGGQLFSQNDRATAVYLLEAGLVKLVCVTPEGRQVIVGLRRPRWILGASAVLLERPRAATAVTLTRCTMRCMAARKFLDTLQSDRDFALESFRTLSEEIYGQMKGVVELSCMPARTRLERLLGELLLSQPDMPAEGPVELEVRFKHGDMAQMLAVTPEYVSRLMKDLEDEGFVARRRGRLTVNDPARFIGIPAGGGKTDGRRS